MNGMPGYNPAMPFPMAMPQNSQYNPHERIEMRPMPGGMSNGRFPHQRAPLVHRDAAANSNFMRKPGELPVIQDLTPRLPPDEQAVPESSTSMPVDAQPQPPVHQVQQDVDMSLPPIPMVGQRNGFRSHRGGARGAFGDAASFRPERRNDKTLVVEKIPEDKLSLGAINDWFKKFGTVTNVAVDPSTSKALVSFADHKEAHTAWKSEEAVFGNRFVKVFWHRPLEGHGQKGSQMLAASANIVAKISAQQPSSSSSPVPAPTTDSPHPSGPSTPIRKPRPQSSAAASLAAKQQLLEQQIAEQKSLMAQLATATGDEKKQVMARLRKLNEEMKPKAEAPVPSSSVAPAASTTRTEAQEERERERLDKELEMHSTATGAEGDGDENTDELKARLAKLKAEVRCIYVRHVEFIR